MSCLHPEQGSLEVFVSDSLAEGLLQVLLLQLEERVIEVEGQTLQLGVADLGLEVPFAPGTVEVDPEAV